MSKAVIFWVALAALVLGGISLLDRPHGEPAGARVAWADEPVQTETGRSAFRRSARGRELTLTPRAEIDVSARVASVSRYRFDELAPLAPIDAVLTWGELPEPPYRGRVRYDQMARFYLWSTRARDLDLRYIETHSANFHLMPANPNVEGALVRLDAGDAARVRGLLVDVDASDGRYWRTSLTRGDTGPGACEIVWVEEIQIGDRRYR